METKNLIFKNKIKFILNDKITAPLIFYNNEKKSFSSLFEILPKNLRLNISKIVEKEKLNKGEVKVFHTFDNEIKNIILIGISKLNIRDFHYFSRLPIKIALKEKIEKIDIKPDDLYIFDTRDQLLNYFEFIKYFVVNIIMADFDFSQYYKKEPEGGWFHIKQINFLIDKNLDEVKRKINEGILISEEVNTARVISNMPGGDMTPEIFVDIIKQHTKDFEGKVKIFNKKQLEKMGMNSILAVGKGSIHPPFLVILEYLPNKKEKPLVYIGKGITFDTGGLHLKPSEGMKDMNLDMSGGASVFTAVIAISKNKIKKNVVALIPIAENFPGADAYRPGDLIKSYSGKVIEIGSPDAEGRVILADAIEYSKKYNPKFILTLATLTGAAMVALGDKVSAILSDLDENEIKKIIDLSYMCGDFVWPLPLWEEYRNDIKPQFGDIWNIGKSRYGGIMHGAVFLWEFAKPFKLVHIDMAPKMVANNEENLSSGSVGFGVKLLYELSKNF